MNEFREKFQIEKFQIQKLGSWIISLRPQQVTLCSLVLSLDRKCPHLGQITEKEGAELSCAFKFVEKLLQKTFNPEKINYLALMMLDHQVHFHIIPRYKDSIEFDDQIYRDKDWPKPPNVLKPLELSENILISLRQHLKNNA
ncbi:MAG: HIT family protein [Aequorivita sp.]